MWTYSQSTGVLKHDDVVIGLGYSGFTCGKNNPKFQCVPEHGPIPQGKYTFGVAEHHPKLGIDAIPLTPSPGDNMFGRSGFFMHGDSLVHPGMASEGCIVMLHFVRLEVINSPDKALTVTV